MDSDLSREPNQEVTESEKTTSRFFGYGFMVLCVVVIILMIVVFVMMT